MFVVCYYAEHFIAASHGACCVGDFATTATPACGPCGLNPAALSFILAFDGMLPIVNLFDQCDMDLVMQRALKLRAVTYSCPPPMMCVMRH